MPKDLSQLSDQEEMIRTAIAVVMAHALLTRQDISSPASAARIAFQYADALMDKAAEGK